MAAIVTVIVSVQLPPAPSTLQQTGAFISQGATTTAAGTRSLLTQLSYLTSILAGALALSGLVWLGGVVTATTAAPHGLTNGDIIELTITGVTPSGYNGTYQCTITGASTFTYPHGGTLVTPATVPGVYTIEDVAELLEMATTFFGQGISQSVYVLELGPGGADVGPAALQALIIASPQFFYAYLVPRDWANQSTFLSMLAGYEAPTAKTYFFTTMTLDNYTDFLATMKCVVGMIEAPGIPSGEFSLAAFFYSVLATQPGATSKVAPFAYRFAFGVTPYPTVGNSAILATLAAAKVNVIGTGAEGGISDTIIENGTTMDGQDFLYWYSVDWVQININLDVTNAVINGSNDPINPLYFDQPGINRLQLVGLGDLEDAITFGMATGTAVTSALDGPAFASALDNGTFDDECVINAIPFTNYTAENPGDYRIGRYAGFAVSYIPATGFKNIVFNVVVTQFINS